nr:MAG TPA: Stage V sporulation protein family [Caudoviricetes sp.]
MHHVRRKIYRFTYIFKVPKFVSSRTFFTRT